MNIIKKYRSYTYLLLLTVLVAITLSACQGMSVHQAYDGPARPETEVATLIIPEAFNILFIDREKFGPALYSGNSNIAILPGKHQVIIKYKDFWDVGDESERVESDPISITLNVIAGHKYQVQFAKLANVEQARAFAKNPSIQIIDPSTHNKVAAAVDYKLYTSGFFSTMFGPSNQGNDNQSNKEQKTEQSSTSKPTSTPTPTTAPVTTPVFAPSSTVGISASTAQASPSKTSTTDSEEKQAEGKNGRALDMLKYWWGTADQAQKEAFQQWIKSQ